jgi:hypothetical protein
MAIIRKVRLTKLNWHEDVFCLGINHLVCPSPMEGFLAAKKQADALQDLSMNPSDNL